MKLKFNSNLDYQNDAIAAVTDLFEGQNSLMSYFTVEGQVSLDETTQGVANRLDISNEDILENLRKIQVKNRISPSEVLKSRDFNIEMETGTGKTYVYLKSIFELNKKYNFTKFIIVVPSLAIKEGVYKSIEITKEHFKGLYDNVIYDYFIYDSQKLEQVRNFAVNSNIQIMVINIDAFRKSFTDPSKETKANIIHRPNDKLNGLKPIELIQETNPIVIIDEPQSSASTDKAKEAIKSLNPLTTLQYSATHKEIQNLVYKLDAIDAHEMNLVKQIEVASFESLDYHNKAYLKLVSVDNKKSPITAKIELDSIQKGNVKRKTVTVRQGDDLSSKKLANRDIYEGYVVNEIYCEEGNEYVDFTNRPDTLTIGKKIGDIDDLRVKRAQIRKTIEEHLEKEVNLNSKGIKVLSLFFIDKVANYRFYDADGNPQKGVYAEIFEEEYNNLIQKPKYHTLTENLYKDIPVEEVHNGYFSQDKSGKKKGQFKDTKGNTIADDDTYNLIMRDKEKLLSFNSNLRFIFSHSALKEGWDNPNVFQICTLNETKSSMKKRQEIGRGLRLCVNQEGSRVKDNKINTLTVMANESYENFAKSLQTEMEKEEGIKFGLIENDIFGYITKKNNKGEYEPIGKQGSMTIFNFFKEKKYIDGKGKVQESLKLAIEEGTVEVPERYEDIKPQIIEVATKRSKNVPVRNAYDKRKVKVNKEVYLSPEFKEFWNKIKHKTTYSVDFDTDELIIKCSEELNKELDIQSPKLLYTKAGVTVDVSGVNVSAGGSVTVDSQEYEVALPDIITFLQNETYLTRKTIVKILIESNTLDQFKKNPQEYMEEALKIINSQLNQMLIDGIKYTKTDDYYAQELFEDSELFGYLEKNMLESERSVYDHVIYDSKIEEEFAKRLEKDENVLVYTKLPGWFKVRTPIGNYNPDWAVLIENDGQKKMYFIVETKGTKYKDSLRPTESNKIKCGRKHFEALDSGVDFKVTNRYTDFIRSI
ncbi:DEAD/DEAH box helicase family protein [Methanobrevibacter sp. OttesenSCG-928-K11]|nr:DEAD/DEAH box helicase family protein [Methanobrevibacter sp. OttesenSCG-928-K11]MDL2271225.1 DEAD/DEAH box helicase family protein [Methanobrevibacter sp. OttesenSCG-928-I08]